MKPSQKRIEQFWDKVAIIPFHTCWEWIGIKDKDGYGRFHVNNKEIRAHRFSLGLTESLKVHKVVDHVCRNRSCVNPAHLRQVSVTQNALENSRSFGALNKLKTKCMRGHQFTQTNTFYRKSGRRMCRTCHRIGALRRYYGHKNSAH